ncbi:hypothetical protein WJ63_01440 [Burkholderia pyrrocinia]|nr:hypothetical protein WJ63_01440 [Burkholderia pyrrocinia]
MLPDLSMPDVDGFALLRALRPIDALRQPQFVAVSGLAQPSDRLRTARAGFDDHLVKPVEMATLDALLQRVAARPAVGCLGPVHLFAVREPAAEG